MADRPYTSQYFERFQEGARATAAVMVPIVLELLEPRSVCDVGCGLGTWLRVFAEHGIDDVFGIDGDYIPRDELEIPQERFLAADLQDGVTLNRTFDLVMCLEVAEHLPQDSAQPLVDSLARLSPAVLFSAAVPMQTGDGHVNEQWPDYWEARFKGNDYLAVDCMRPRVWNANRLPIWYLQNTILFVQRAFLESHPRLKLEYERSKERPLSIVHPRMYRLAATRHLNQIKRLMESVESGDLDEQEFRATITRMLSRWGEWLK